MTQFTRHRCGAAGFRTALVLFLTLFGIARLFAQEITVEGFVLDRDRKPIDFANVKVEGKIFGASTNGKGYYKFTMLPTGDSLSISFSCLGYRTVVKHFPSLKTNLKLNVELPSTAHELGSVVVSASARKPTATLQHIGTGAIRANVSPTGSIESLVSTLAGVSQTNELSSQYSVRGGSYDENLVYVNGIEIYRPLLIRSAEQEGLSFVNPDLTERVLFSAGGFTAEYGDKISSVLDIRYKRPQQLQGSVSLGLLGSTAYIGSRHGRFTHITGIRYKSGSSLLSSLSNTRAEYDPHYFDAQTFLTLAASKNLTIGLMGNLSLTTYRFVPESRLTNFGTQTNMKQLKVYFDGQERDRFLSGFGALTFDFIRTPDERHNLTLAAFSSQEQETYDITSEYILNSEIPDDKTGDNNDIPGRNALGLGHNHEHARNHLASHILNAIYRLDRSIGDRHRIGLGIEYKHEFIRDHINEWEQRDSLGYSLPRRPDLLAVYRNLYSDQKISSWRASGFFQDRISLELNAGDLALIPGARFSYWSFNRELTISPRFLVSFTPRNRQTTYRVGAGLYYQAPFYKELRLIEFDNRGNRTVRLNNDIKSQQALTLLAGLDYDFHMGERKFRFTAEAFYKGLYRINPYIRENVKVIYYGENIGRGYVYGLDMRLFGEFVPGVDSWLSLSLQKSNQHLKGLGTMPLLNAPAYNVSLFFQDYFPGFKRISLSLRGVLSGPLPELNPAKGFSLPAFTGSAYKRVDIGMQYIFFEDNNRETTSRPVNFLRRVFRQTALGLDVFNLFDISNVNSYYWVSDVYNQQYAVPNYLTRRQWNVRLSVKF